MNETPEPTPKPTAEPTPLDTPHVQLEKPSVSELPASEMSAQEIEAKMALLPDYADEAFPSGTALSSSDGAAGGVGVDKVDAPTQVVATGCLSGLGANLVLAVALLVLQRAGVSLHGPGVVAVVLGLIVLVLLCRTWPRRVWLGAGGFALGLGLSFAAMFLFVRPMLDANAAPPTSGAPGLNGDLNGAPPPSDGPAS